MTREIGPELVARIRHVADSLEAIAKCDIDSPQPFAAAYAVYLNGEYDSSYGPDAIDEALEIAAECNGEVVPLYRTPQAHATPGEGSVQGEGTVGMADIAHGAAENLQGVCKTFDQWSRETACVMYRLARHIELLESRVPSEAEREAISMAYSRLTAEYNYGEVAATLKAFLERTNHDAVPAATAEEPESSVPLGSGSALANTSEPVAWVAFATDGSESSAVYSMREQAQAAADDWGWSFAPLYARLPLTDKELAALKWFEEVRKPLNSFDDGEYVATLRNLLEKTK
jgi:hypothetical protein